jgi:hypothetical protein
MITPQRRNTLKGLKAAMGFEKREMYHYQTNSLKTLNLPPSIPNLDSCSPDLWGWILEDSSHVPQVYSPAGELILQVPAHLTRTVSERTLVSSASVSTISSNDSLKRSNTSVLLRKPVQLPRIPSNNQGPKVKRFFLKGL